MKNLSVLILTALFLFNFAALMAVPADPHPVKMKQPNGEEITVIVRGDENFRLMTSDDGYTLMYDNNKYLVYATTNKDGDLIPSSIVAKDQQFRSNSVNAELQNIPKGLTYSQNQRNSIRQLEKIKRNIFQSRKNQNFRNSNATNIKAICALVQFPDKSFEKTKDDFNALFNQVGYNINGSTGSVKDYFAETSYNQLNMDFTIVGPITLSKSSDYYGANVDNGVESYSRLMEFAKETADQVFAILNPNDYAMDIDGYKFVAALHILYAGAGEESSYVENEIWAHSTTVNPPLDYQGIKFDVYSTTAELRGSGADKTITSIGRICHEVTHLLGAPDFYDANADAGGSFDGTGKWDLMASGNWNNSGYTPAHINMYQKIDFGWVIPDILNVPTVVNSMPNSAQNKTAYKIETVTPNEYFLLENRQKTGFDSYIPHHGLLIYRVSITDDDIYDNKVNNTHPQKVYPVCASATVDIPNSSKESYGNIDDAGCPFPGSTGKTEFTDNTTPSAKAWNGSNTVKPITDITESGDKIAFKFMLGTGVSFSPENFSNIYPNPVPKGAFVNIDADSGAEITIFDISGKIKKTVTSKGNATSVAIGWESGTYIIQTTINGQIVQKKIIVK
ncbi:MAG: M6 family metalloprotease domain-containing protein [Dysgonamonadaceae bacterium]|jgi:M6 family metalloprotease-like protein|nr:M6 family metalloprotease domain-containing protein [Dysgonamonadaceae bacterium]